MKLASSIIHFIPRLHPAHPNFFFMPRRGKFSSETKFKFIIHSFDIPQQHAGWLLCAKRRYPTDDGDGSADHLASVTFYWISFELTTESDTEIVLVHVAGPRLDDGHRILGLNASF